MILYNNSKSKIKINRKTSKAFDVTKGWLQGYTLAPFLFIIVLDYILRQTIWKLQCPNKIFTDLDFAADIVLLDENSESAIRHVTCVEETVGLNINFQKTKVFFINSNSSTLVVGHQQIEPVSDF